MKYFQVTTILFLLLFGMFLLWRFHRRLRFDFGVRFLSRRLWQANPRAFYDGEAVRRAVRRLSSKKLSAFDFAAFLPSLAPAERPSWLAMQGREAEVLAMEASTDERLKTLQAEIWRRRGSREKSAALLTEINPRRLSRYWQGRYNLLLGWAALNEGDLQGASEQGSAAVKIFERGNYPYEEAEALLMLGTVYRVSALSDASRFMLQAAQKIFHDIGALSAEASVWGNLGMLKVMDSLWDEAESDFDKAAALYCQAGDELGAAEIANQQALSSLLRNQLSAAEDGAGQAYAAHLRMNNPAGQAFSLELLARVGLAGGLWDKTADYAARAAEIYHRENNLSALQEVKMIEASARWQKHDAAGSEEVLRSMLELNKKHHSCYHIANVYNFLGLIFLEQGDYRRAKGFFQQSLDCELASGRDKGAALDYANLALVDRRRGLPERAAESLEKALEIARTSGDEDLCRLIQNQIKASS